MITANFLAVALTAAVLPFLYRILLKKSARCVSFKFPIALAAFLSAILSRLLPLGILWLKSYHHLSYYLELIVTNL